MNSHDAILIYKENVDVIDTTLTSLLVTVSDVAGLCIDVTVEVEILNVFKKPKILNLPRKIAVSEDVPPGQIFSIETVDEDFGEENVDVYFRVLNGDPELFELQGKNFHLRYPRRLNYERTPLHLIEFIADNGHVASDNVTLTLEVVDVNEAPVFFESIFYVTVEDAEAGTIILPDLRKIVSDSDLDDTITFSLSSSQETFRINPVSGTISLVADYDVDHDVMTSDVILIVKAVDSGLLSATAEVNVKIVYKNERPRILNLPREITVPEDLKGDRIVYRVVGEDPDDDDVTLRMSVMDGDGRLFSFNESDGTVTIKQTARLDFETQSTFTFRFFADDGNLTSSPEILTLRISDVNEAPYFTRDILYISTSEGPAGTTISDAGIFSSAKDPENDTLTFDLRPSPRASGFSVDTESAEVMFAVDFVLTRQSSPVSVYLTIRVRDSGNLTATARLKITIHDANTRPSLLYLPANITIHKPMPQGTLLYTAHAEDKDNDTLLFRLNVLQGGRRDLFHFNSTSGELSLAKGMSSPQTTFFSLEISVTDGLLSSQAAIVTIFVLGDAKPAVVTSDPYVITVREDELVYPIPLPDDLFIENSLSTVIAEYSISGGTGQDYLLIDSATGYLVFARSYDIDDPYVNSTLTLEITLSNSGERVTKNVQVEVVDVNDNAPEVTSDLLTWFVDKAIVIETVIGQIEARDRDGGKNGELDYEIVSADSVPLDLFRINSNGEVIVNKPLSWVKTSLTKLQVVVSDRGQPPLTTTVGVFLVFS
ncbi:cadherin EGF LAG seven-pass G-type receptor 3-like [Littorina saxatilis]|uniref:cadherin EGF LAG seven-pass G-type receptor 3-like n=1 Tax=Littorina saxatilis TaxID=31220 RepID=UPI0038B49738